MNYNEGKPIYLQIADNLCESVLRQLLQNGERVLSVREMAVKMAVNPNTVIRAYAYLEEQNVISMQRGVGYFLTEDALDNVMQLKRREFMENDVPAFFKSMSLLGIGMDELAEIYKKWGMKN